MLYPLSYRGMTASLQRAAIRTISARTYRGPQTSSRPSRCRACALSMRLRPLPAIVRRPAARTERNSPNVAEQQVAGDCGFSGVSGLTRSLRWRGGKERRDDPNRNTGRCGQEEGVAA